MNETADSTPKSLSRFRRHAGVLHTLFVMNAFLIGSLIVSMGILMAVKLEDWRERAGLGIHSWGNSYVPPLSAQKRYEELRYLNKQRDGFKKKVVLHSGTVNEMVYEQVDLDSDGIYEFERVRLGEGDQRVTYERNKLRGVTPSPFMTKISIGGVGPDETRYEYRDRNEDGILDEMHQMRGVTRVSSFVLFEDEWRSVEVTEDGEFISLETPDHLRKIFAFVDAQWIAIEPD